jgi:hypothetical protein
VAAGFPWEETGGARSRSLPPFPDGCGHREGETLDVLLPENPSGEFTVQTTGALSDTAPLSVRLATLMLCLSGMAGGFYAYLVSRPVPRLRSAA